MLKLFFFFIQCIFFIFLLLLLQPILQHAGWILQWTGAKIAWLMSTILQPTWSFPMSEEGQWFNTTY
jgi:hypothetical protein